MLDRAIAESAVAAFGRVIGVRFGAAGSHCPQHDPATVCAGLGGLWWRRSGLPIGQSDFTGFNFDKTSGLRVLGSQSGVPIGSQSHRLSDRHPHPTSAVTPDLGTTFAFFQRRRSRRLIQRKRPLCGKTGLSEVARPSRFSLRKLYTT
jgi:hypothetical protein